VKAGFPHEAITVSSLDENTARQHLRSAAPRKVHEGPDKEQGPIARKKPHPRPAQREKHRVGRRIRVREVRVIGADGEMLGIMQTQEALDLAEQQGLQLVEVSPNSNPPVCKILDYGKFKYETAKRERDAKKNKRSQDIKEVKFRPKTGEHDFDFKVKHARRFIEEGSKVRLLVQFRGREIVHPETGRAVLERVCRELADVATVNSMPVLEGNRMNMVLAPKPGRAPARPRPRDEEAEAGEAAERDEAPVEAG
jgi:translation initiation factor IF-3